MPIAPGARPANNVVAGEDCGENWQVSEPTIGSGGLDGAGTPVCMGPFTAPKPVMYA